MNIYRINQAGDFLVLDGKFGMGGNAALVKLARKIGMKSRQLHFFVGLSELRCREFGPVITNDNDGHSDKSNLGFSKSPSNGFKCQIRFSSTNDYDCYFLRLAMM